MINRQLRFVSRFAALLVLVTAGCASTGGTPGEERITIDVASEPQQAMVRFRDNDLGPTPLKIEVESIHELLEIVAEQPQGTLVERRVRMLDPQHSEVLFRFDAEPTPLAKALGLATVVVFDYSERATFDTDSYGLKPEFLPMLSKQADLLNGAFSGIDVYVCGHTDNTGSLEHNLKLSLQRALAVADVLMAHGVAEDRLHVQGFGEEYPIAGNDTEGGKAMNRRTEVLLPQ
jgi:outer membrane protein OmpA-like peptidoglycan-associated protein